MAEISFICKRTVVSTKPVEPQKFTTLSVLDRIMERNHLRMVFYYDFPARSRPGELTDKLRESISEMLSHFPVVMGRLLRNPEGQWIVKCNDAGVRMVEAMAKGSVDEWLKNVNREKEMKLIHWEEMSHKTYFWATFYIQITEFENGGLAIGLSCTHLLSDPISATMMIKAWADTTLKGEITSPPLFHTLPSQKQQNQETKNLMISHYLSSIQNSSSPISNTSTKQTTITLQFTQEMVRTCISMATTQDHVEVMPFEALAALFWTRISKLKGRKTTLVDMSICLDMRKVIGLENSFFGNCMVYNMVQGDENEVTKAAGYITEAVSRMDCDEVMNLFEWLEQKNCEHPPLVNGSRLICVSLENVDAYSAVFEDNTRHVHVSCYIEPAVGPGQIIIAPSADGAGPDSRVVVVTLPEDEAEKLLEDDVIKKVAPLVLMGMNKLS